MRKLYLWALFLFATFQSLSQTLSGYVREAKSQESLSDVHIRVKNTRIGTTSNVYGFYSIKLDASREYELEFSKVGYQSFSKKILLTANQNLIVELTPSNTLLEEVKVHNTENEDPSTLSLQMSDVKQLPSFLGEKDVLKTFQLLPGVQKGNEGSQGLSVRGGSSDQNLLMLDDAVVYNAYHLFGFFSVFNNDAIKQADLYKGGFSAKYGGRTSSVLDMQMKEGSHEKFHGEGSIELLSSKITLEGPIKFKYPTSYIVSARRTYVDLILPRSLDIKNTSFYDLNAKINTEFNAHNRLYLSGYFGRDVSKDVTKYRTSGFGWGNATATLRWNHLFSDKVFANTSLIFSHFRFKIFQEESFGQKFYEEYYSQIQDFGLKSDFDIYLNPAHTLKAGILATHHQFTPSAYIYNQYSQSINTDRIKQTNGIESAIYLEDTWRISEKMQVRAGLRASNYFVDSKAYHNLEPRLNASFQATKNLNITASYARMSQYLHLLSNSSLDLPTDLWVSSGSKIPPQRSDQVTLGFTKNFSNSPFSLSVEGYHKSLENVIGYKDGASFLLLDIKANKRLDGSNWEDNIAIGTGKSYGMEVLLQKKTGRLTGWISYTLSQVKHRFADLNNGKAFFPHYDRRHALSLVGIYQLKPHITLSGSWIYATGNALTVPIGQYIPETHQFPVQADYPPSGGSLIVARVYDERGNFKAADYHRLDVNVRFSKQKKKFLRVWELGVFNAYNRVNPFYYESQDAPNSTQRKLYRKGLFPIIPSISYQIKF